MTYKEFEKAVIACENHDEIMGWRIVKYREKYRCYITIPNSFSGQGMSAGCLQDSHEFKSVRLMYDFIVTQMNNTN